MTSKNDQNFMHSASVSPSDANMQAPIRGGRRRGDELKANYRAQVGALMRKQLTYQRRNKGQNCCLLSAPIFFCVLLLIIQFLVNNALSTEDFKCGCECTLCYNNEEDQLNGITSGTDTAAVNNRPCQYTRFMKCLPGARNNNNCGTQFSTPIQSVFCSIDDPLRFPELLRVPRKKFRDSANRPNLTIVAMDETVELANEWTSRFVPSLNFDKIGEGLATLVQYFTNGNDLSQDDRNEQLQAVLQAFRITGMTLGTTESADQFLYLDTAWFGGSDDNPGIYILNDNCTEFNRLARVFVDSLDSPFNTLVSTGSLAKKTNETISISLLNGLLNFICIEERPAPYTNATALDRRYFCGFYDAECDGFPEINEYTAGIDYTGSSAAGPNIRLLYNDTNMIEGNQGSSLQIMRLGKPINMAVNAWLNKYVSENYLIDYSYFSNMPKARSVLKLDFSSLLGPVFYMWVLLLLLPVMLQSMVYEKEKRLRVMMKMMGLDNRTYVSVTFSWWLIVYILYFFLLMIFGTIIGLKFFRLNSPGIQILTYLLHGLLQISFAFLLSCFFKSPKTAAVFGYIYVFLAGLIANILLANFFDRPSNDKWVWILELIPGFSLYRGLWEFSEYSFLGVYRRTKGMTSENLKDAHNGIRIAWAIMIIEFLIFMPLSLYLELVIDDKTGIRRPWNFIFEWCIPSLRARRDDEEERMQREFHQRNSNGADQAGANPDVEQEKARAMALGPANSDQCPIIVHGLRKIYSALDGGKPKLAVKELTMAVERGECFGLLGPNGAGKTTSISMLIGFLEPTAGTAFVEGLDIRTQMQAVYSRMGVCPQHDILWDTLTGREHLLFYGRLKNLTGQPLQDAVKEALRGVNLLHAADKMVGQYSGGMKRRLSVAISFMGKPAVVYLDEPSTGLDPASRRALWDVIRDNKQGKGIILTTHSMQEAEVLCDRLGIFVNGELFCLGAPKELSARYGGYLVMTVTTTEQYAETVQRFVRRLAPSATIKYALGGTQKFQVPVQEVALSTVFDAMSAQKEFPCMDWAVHHASLEDVFIEVSRAAGAKVSGKQ